MLGQHCDMFFAGFLDRIQDEQFKQWLYEFYDTEGYFDPDRRPGPGDALKTDSGNA